MTSGRRSSPRNISRMCLTRVVDARKFACPVRNLDLSTAQKKPLEEGTPPVKRSRGSRQVKVGSADGARCRVARRGAGLPREMAAETGLVEGGDGGVDRHVSRSAAAMSRGGCSPIWSRAPVADGADAGQWDRCPG